MRGFDTISESTRRIRASDVALDSLYIALSKALDTGNTDEAERLTAMIAVVKQR